MSPKLVWLISEHTQAELLVHNAFFSIVRYPLDGNESQIIETDNDNLLFDNFDELEEFDD